jgi:pectate lyase
VALPWAVAQTYQGFGASTPGGAGQPVYRVKTLADTGAGSLRDAVSQGHRLVVFDVAGELSLRRDIYVRGAFITIEGSTAPSPGITLRNHGLLIHGTMGANDVIVRGIRVRDSQGCDSCDSSGAGLGISRHASNVVVDHVSVHGAGDQAISIGRDAHDITVQWSIFAEGARKNLPVLIGYRAQRISFHHNLIIKGTERMPQLMWSHAGDQAGDTQVDLRNNLLWDWKNMATQVWKGARANVVGNYYYSPYSSEVGQRRAIYVCHAASTPPQCDGSNPQWFARAYIADNISGHGPEITAYLNRLGTERQPFPAPTIETSAACTAARRVLNTAGVRPPDSVDQRYLAQITLAGCPTAPSPAQR